MICHEDLQVSSLGECRYPSPLLKRFSGGDADDHFVSDSDHIRFRVEMKPDPNCPDDLCFEEAGPRKHIFFNPEETTAAIVTCGGLAPGLNNVIYSAVDELRDNYGVQRVLGIRHGYRGLNPEYNLPPMELTHEAVDNIHKLGGTILGSSRGPQDLGVMAEFLAANKVNVLLTLGGDGTQRGAYELYTEMHRRGLPIASVGVPKTIDNDIPFVELSFGFTTALEKAAEVIRGIHVEARGFPNGIGIVKLMGRNAGFIAAGASIVSQEVNYCLVPEIRFPLDGDNGLLPALEQRMRKRGHAVIVVAEGAGQDLFDNAEVQRDASGNIRHHDIGGFLQDQIKLYFGKRDFPITLRYVDPSYYIRSVPANSYDRYLTDQMARNAVHAAMAGKTGMIIGSMHRRFINVPSPVVTSQEKKLQLIGHLWRAVLTVTRQPQW